MAGRPRIHPIGTTPSDRARMARAARKAAGGADCRVQLSPACRDALDVLGRAAGDPSRNVTVERLVDEALARLDEPSEAEEAEPR